MITRKSDVRTEYKYNVDLQRGSKVLLVGSKEDTNPTFTIIIWKKRDFSPIVNGLSYLNHRNFLQKEIRINIRKTDSLHWPWVGAAFLWQISEIVGHTNSFSFGELENLIMWYKTQLSSVPTSVRRGFSLVSFLFTWKVLHTFFNSKENYAVQKKSRIVQREVLNKRPHIRL